MSLLNDVLQDLDTRRNPSPASDPNQDLLREYASAAPVFSGAMQRFKRGPVIGGVVVILLVVGAAVWWLLREEKPTGPMPAPVSATLEAAGGENASASEAVSAMQEGGSASNPSPVDGPLSDGSGVATESSVTPDKNDDGARKSAAAMANNGSEIAANPVVVAANVAGEVPEPSENQGKPLKSLGTVAKQKFDELIDSASSAIRSALPGETASESGTSVMSRGSESETITVSPVSMLPAANQPRQVAPIKPVERNPGSKKITPAKTIKPASRQSVRAVSSPNTHSDRKTRSGRPPSPPTGIKRLYEQDLQMRAYAEQLIRGGSLAEAEAELHKFVRENPGAQHSRSTLAGLLIQMNRAEEGEKILLGGIVLDSNGRDRVKLMARAQMARGDFDAALRLLDANQLEITEDAEYHSLRGALYQKTGRYAPAAKLYRQLLSEMPAQPAWYVGLAIALESLGQRREAIMAYRQVRDLHGAQPVLKNYAVERIAALTR